MAPVCPLMPSPGNHLVAKCLSSCYVQACSVKYEHSLLRVVGERAAQIDRSGEHTADGDQLAGSMRGRLFPLALRTKFSDRERKLRDGVGIAGAVIEV